MLGSSWKEPFSTLMQPSFRIDSLNTPSMIMGLTFGVGFSLVETFVPS